MERRKHSHSLETSHPSAVIPQPPGFRYSRRPNVIGPCLCRVIKSKPIAAVPLPSTSGSFLYIFHLIDYFSRFSHAWATLKDDEATVIDCLSRFCSYFCRPIAIYSDKGTHLVHEYLLRQGIEHTKTSSYSPNSAGMIERRNGMISSIMVKYINTDGNTVEWDSHVDEATRQRNFHQLGYLGFTPFQIRQPRRRLPL